MCNSVNQAKNSLSEKEFFKLIGDIYNFSKYKKIPEDKNYIIKDSDVIKKIKTLFQSCKASSRRRNSSLRVECTEFNLTQDDILKLKDKQNNRCAYSGRFLTWTPHSPNKASIDRIDSDKGYIPDNIQLTCFLVNQAKSNLTEEQFLEMIDNIYHTSIKK